MSDDVLATAPSSGMVLMQPEDCTLLLKLCTVMKWEPKLPLHIMRDESARRWFMKGKPGAQDYWIRDSDIDVLKATPMWPTVLSAKPYGVEEVIKPLPPLADWEAMKAMGDKLAWDKEAIMKAMLDGLPLPPKPPQIRGKSIDFAIIDDIDDDPVERDRQEAAKARLASEAALKKLDEWE
jgi:hypothetical protein